jgi:hypothetical protein
MKEKDESDNDVVSPEVRSAVLSLGERFRENCKKAEVMLNGFEMKQIKDSEFSLNEPFKPAESSLTKTTLMKIHEIYESLRRDVRDITETAFVEFEVMFPRIDINFETYYSVCVSLLNLIYQMQLMRLHCYRLLQSSSS